MPDRPVIGLSTYREEARWRCLGHRGRPAARARTPARSRPPAPWRCCCRRRSTEPMRWCSRLDGLIISGGPDVDPARYGAEPHPLDPAASRPTGTPGSSRCSTPRRPPASPTLGICRGMQLMAVRGGGSPAAARARRRRPRRALPGCRTRSAGSRSRRSPGPACGSWSVIGCRSTATTTRPWPPIPVTGPPLAQPTARSRRSRPSRIRNGRSGWPCSGTLSTATTTASSAGWWRPPAPRLRGSTSRRDYVDPPAQGRTVRGSSLGEGADGARRGLPGLEPHGDPAATGPPHPAPAVAPRARRRRPATRSVRSTPARSPTVKGRRRTFGGLGAVPSVFVPSLEEAVLEHVGQPGDTDPEQPNAGRRVDGAQQGAGDLGDHLGPVGRAPTTVRERVCMLKSCSLIFSVMVRAKSPGRAQPSADLARVPLDDLA